MLLDAFQQELTVDCHVVYIEPNHRSLAQGQVTKVTAQKVVINGHTYLDPYLTVRIGQPIFVPPWEPKDE